MKMEFITYGHIVEPGKFKAIQDNREFEFLQKPEGGLWCSPTDSEWGWKDWCLAEDFWVDRLKIWTKFELLPETKILVIDSYMDLLRVGREYGEIKDYGFTRRCLIRFSRIQKDGYHGIFLTELGNAQCHLPMHFNSDLDLDLNSWDCESMILFDLDCIRIIEKNGREEDLESLPSEIA